MKLILASGSPRRRELLAAAGFKFELHPADVDENIDETDPERLVELLAKKKANHIWNIRKDKELDHTAEIIIGADTIVAIDSMILGKPTNEGDAFLMLKRLQGRHHVVYTGVALVSSERIVSFVERTTVYMRNLTDEEIYEYIATGEPHDKAGAYGIQERGAVLIERVEGDYYSVMGLPLCRLNKELSKWKFSV